MKIDMIEGKYIVYLNKYNLFNEDVINKNSIEKILKKIFIHLKKYYKIYIYGYFEIDCYIDKNYGAILEIEEDKDFSFYKNRTETQISFYEFEIFFYKIDDYFIKDILDENNINIHIIDGSFYITFNKPSDKQLAYIVENSTGIIYKEINKI